MDEVAHEQLVETVPLAVVEQVAAQSDEFGDGDEVIGGEGRVGGPRPRPRGTGVGSGPAGT
ncbi:hypothetical protein AB0B50_26615 [Streptomyces sp. NPDC041068]|uniref:hypothetical protein n=1 Tax=Streptomyces sp. NPDC041068 TaxID=3155130 RepID=UPI0033FDEE32